VSHDPDPYAADQLRPTIDQGMVERLVASQFPQWAALPVRPVATSGWDNRTFHLGDELSVRLPSGREYAEQVDKEHRWLPRLAPQLPITVSQPLEVGVPGEGYPFGWSIYRWLPGDTALAAPPADLTSFATEVGGFHAGRSAVDLRRRDQVDDREPR
jgi:aminoglycoside phosphotransferase (APT) family kinase protein